jgi:hypothetical protein
VESEIARVLEGTLCRASIVRANQTSAYRIRKITAVQTSTNEIIAVKTGNSAPPHKLSISEMKNTVSNTSSAGWISNGFDKRTMSWEDLPGQKELLNRFNRDGRRISPDLESGEAILDLPTFHLWPPVEIPPGKRVD